MSFPFSGVHGPLFPDHDFGRFSLASGGLRSTITPFYLKRFPIKHGVTGEEFLPRLFG
jgi:hypothetical protein